MLAILNMTGKENALQTIAIWSCSDELKLKNQLQVDKYKILVNLKWTDWSRDLKIDMLDSDTTSNNHAKYQRSGLWFERVIHV